MIPADYIALDTETGGLDPYRTAILQIGFYDPKNKTGGSICIEPGRGLVVTEQAKYVNGWPESHRGKRVVSELEAAKAFSMYLSQRKPAWVLCHNAAFDVPFVRELGVRTGVAIDLPRGLCTMTLARTLSNHGLYRGGRSLDHLIKEFLPDYKRADKHDATDDAIATALVYEAMNRRLSEALTKTPYATNRQPKAES